MHERRDAPEEFISQLSLYPTEDLLWDELQSPDIASCLRRQSLALPKLGLQYLSMRDYLLRNFALFRLSSAYDMRLDLEDAIERLAPHVSSVRRVGNEAATDFNGVARMATPIDSCRVDKIARPRVGEMQPSFITATVSFSLQHMRQSDWRNEWDNMRRHDVLFLVTLDANKIQRDDDATFVQRFGVVAVRGCSLIDVCDANGNAIEEDRDSGKRHILGDQRKLRVQLDAQQYYRDNVSSGNSDAADAICRSFNVIVRRKPKENNFKNVLEAIRDLIRESNSDDVINGAGGDEAADKNNNVVPQWLHDALLGYGDVDEATSQTGDSLDFVDTFLDADHIRESFPNRRIVFENAEKSNEALAPPYRLSFKDDDSVLVTHYSALSAMNSESSSLLPMQNSDRNTRRNVVRFAPSQIDAILRGMRHGLSLIVGPPGTGKTDVAVQIVSNLYHTYPSERILLVAHSNNALNNLFEKLVRLDIDPRHMLRLGHGANEVDALDDYSRFGRISHMLSRRLALLEMATRLAHALPRAPVTGDIDTCHLAHFLFTEHVRPQYEAWRALGGRTEFPFAAFERGERGIAPTAALLPGDGMPVAEISTAIQEQRLAAGAKSFAAIRAIFDELADCRAMEIMRSAHHRGDFMTTQQARIVAMTTTHAAIRRAELIRAGFGFDSLVMEEAAQVTEIETLIPLLLQSSPRRLRRAALIGDQRQLPPVVKSAALRQFAHFDQSLFARLIRLGVAHVELDRQGRARPQLAKLYDWRYPSLKNLDALVVACNSTAPNDATAGIGQTLSDGSPAGMFYARANAGLAHVAQCINVENYMGKGETAPLPHFYQNLGEAEYVVAMFMYMRTLGYPPSRITILTTYKGQKHLIRDVLKARCGDVQPKAVSTVDRYQGQQNDYILLSLVRTSAVGYVRDVRRLIVAMSRARLGLYVFCRRALFAQCRELAPSFEKLLTAPDQLELVANERYGQCTRTVEHKLVRGKETIVVADVAQLGRLVSP